MRHEAPVDTHNVRADPPRHGSRQLKVLISAYACEPGKGSEPGLGWKLPREMAGMHEVWVLTRANNQPAIEQELAQRPMPNLHFRYVDLPSWARWWKRGPRGVQLYYYLWQMAAYVAARRLCRDVNIDIIHHVTFVKYWMPSFTSLLPRPFIWGPVGGGESAPAAFARDFSWRGKLYEAARSLARVAGEHDPFVRLTARRSAMALATTPETAARLRALGARNVQVYSESGVSDRELEDLDRHARVGIQPARFISMGRLLHWKGFHLGIRAFAQLDSSTIEYWIVGDGPERATLQRLAGELGVSARVTFWGSLPREEAFAKLGKSTALIHPSLHDSGGMVCLEAMASGRPVVCLDLGGPAMQVTEDVGIRVAAIDPDQAVDALAAAMVDLATDRGMAVRMGEAASRRIITHFLWNRKATQFDAWYRELSPPG